MTGSGVRRAANHCMHTLKTTTTAYLSHSPSAPVPALPSQPQSPCRCAVQQRPTLGEAIHDYVIHLRAAGRAAATIESYGKCLQVLADSLGIAAPLAALSEGRLDAAVAGFDSSCSAMAQGPTRLARGQAFGKLVNEKFGAKHEVTIVPLCGHNARCMFTAEAALPILFPKQ